MVRQEAPLVKHVCLETVNRPAVQYQERTASPAVRGVCSEYGEIRNEVPTKAGGSVATITASAAA